MAAMYESLIHVFVTAFYAYAVAGAVFALAFVTVGVTALDRQAQGAGIGFRIIILPGVAALWPLLLLRWIRGADMRTERTPHP